MALRRVQVSDFRCLQSVELEFDPRYTLISGPNAAGKTSLLEAIYVLGRGRSFRTRRLERLIRTGADRFVVFGEIDWASRRIALGLEGSDDGVRARMAGERASVAQLAPLLPAQIIDPEVHRLIEDGPAHRRRFLDWGVFHVEHQFLKYWQRYQHVLKQRNAALRARQPRTAVAAWDPELLKLGEEMTTSRSRYVESLGEAAHSVALRLLGMELRLVYRWGWSQDMTFAEALQHSAANEQEAGATQVGPQRAELSITLDGLAVKDRISRGQQKLLAATLLIAQLKLFPADAPIQPALLLDDPAAELDSERLADLIREVGAHAPQLIVTTLSGQLPAFGSPGRHYRLQAGSVERLA
jgi:DNA replication and repair protein RecF